MFPSGWRLLASQRPTARVAGSGSAKLRLLTCDRRHQHTLSAKTCAVFYPHERQAPSIHLPTRRGNFEASSEAAGRRNRAGVVGCHGDAGPSSLHARDATGGLTPAPWKRRMSPGGAPAQVLRGQSAQTSHHIYPGRSQMVVHRVRCQAAAGGPRHSVKRNSRTQVQSGFFFWELDHPGTTRLPRPDQGWPCSCWALIIKLGRRWLGRLLRLSCRRSAPWLGGGTFAYPASSIQPARSPQRSLHCDRLSSIKLPDSERTSPVESFVVPSWYAWGDSWTRSVFLRLARRPSDPR